MEQLTEIAKALGGMPLAALVVLVILSAFGLAAYTVWAAVKISGKGSHGK